LTEDDRLHTQEVQRIWNLVKDDLKPTRLFNAAIGALSELSESEQLQSDPQLKLPSPNKEFFMSIFQNRRISY